MLLPHPRSLREKILHILAQFPLQTAPDLLRRLKGRGSVVTKQGLYKELRVLLQDSVVIKYQRAYTLSLPWILNFSQFSDQMFDTYLGQSTLTAFLPEGKTKARWTFRNLAMLNDFWVELIFCALKESPRQVFYNWLPHPWFLLLQSMRSQTFNQGMLTGSYQPKTILGHQSALDQEYARRQSRNNPRETISFAESPFHGQDNIYFELIGEYLIIGKLHPRVASLIEGYFSSKEHTFEGPWIQAAAAELRANRDLCTLQIERGTPLVKKITKQLLQFWG